MPCGCRTIMTASACRVINGAACSSANRGALDWSTRRLNDMDPPGRSRRRGPPEATLINSLGISLSYEEIHADLWMACAVVYRS